MNKEDFVTGDMRPFALLQHVLKQGPDGYSYHRLLGRMKNNSIQLSSLAEDLARSRKSVYRFVDPLVEQGLIREENNQYQLTCAGASIYKEILQQTENLVKDEDYDENPLSFIFGAKSRMPILQRVRAGTELKANLVDECSSSESTVRRALGRFEEYGWVSRQGGRIEVLNESEQAMAAYSELLGTAQIVIDNGQFLRRLGPEYAGMPIEALDEADLFVETDSDRERVAKVTGNLSGLDVEQIRGTVPVHTQMSADSFQEHFKGDTKVELIIGPGVHREILRSQNIFDFKEAIGNGVSNFTMRSHPDIKSVGFGIFDSELVIMAADEGHARPAGIICKDDAFVEWVEERFEQLWEESSPMLEHFRKVASSVATRANNIIDSLVN